MLPRDTHSRSIPAAVDRRIGDLAAHQHGVIGRPQLEAMGLSRSAILSRMQRGWLRPVHRGVYAVGHDRLTDRGRWLAGVLAGGGTVGSDAAGPSLGARHGAVLSHRSAAALHGLMARDRGTTEITTTTSRRSRPSLRVHRTGSIERSTTVREGIPCTTVARTLIDIAATENDVAAERAWSTAASRNLIRRRDIEYELGRGARPGTAFVRAAFEQDFGFLAQRTRSDLERDALRFCRDFGLPRPSANRLIRVGDLWFEADLLWAESRLIVEVDGDGPHGHAAARRADRRRDETLQLAGWRTVRIGRRELSTGDRAATAARLSAALAQPRLRPAPGVTD